MALPNGRPCEDRIILKEFEKLREKAGLPRVVFHSLRHPYVKSTTKKFIFSCPHDSAFLIGILPPPVSVRRQKSMKSFLFFRQHTAKSCAAFSVIKRNPHNQFLSSVVSCKAVPYLKGNIYPFIRININLINQKIN